MPSQTDYLGHVARQQKAAAQEYKEWLASLSPKELKKVQDLGLDTPPEDTHRVAGHNPNEQHDAAESIHARCDFAYPAPSLAPTSGPLSPALPDDAPSMGHLLDNMEVLRRIIGILISEDNVKIATLALAFALNMDALNGLGSLREAAKRIGVSVAAISKKKIWWEDQLGLHASTFSKTDKARKALATAQKTKHWRHALWKRPTSATPAPSPSSPPTSMPQPKPTRS